MKHCPRCGEFPIIGVTEEDVFKSARKKAAAARIADMPCTTNREPTVNEKDILDAALELVKLGHFPALTAAVAEVRKALSHTAECGFHKGKKFVMSFDGSMFTITDPDQPRMLTIVRGPQEAIGVVMRGV